MGNLKIQGFPGFQKIVGTLHLEITLHNNHIYGMEGNAMEGNAMEGNTMEGVSI